ncbi:MAG: hypothetical protein ABIY55_06190 [Kofleriaceae bacterium]
MIWEPFILALVLGIIVSAGLYFAYLWPSVEPLEPEATVPAAPVGDPIVDPIAAVAEPTAAPADDPASPT